jgi:hypothetical protein
MCNWWRAESPEISTTIMDTMTYASVAALPWSVAQTNNPPNVPETEFALLNLSFLNRIVTAPTERTPSRGSASGPSGRGNDER